MELFLQEKLFWASCLRSDPQGSSEVFGGLIHELDFLVIIRSQGYCGINEVSCHRTLNKCFQGMAHKNSDRFSRAWVSNLKPDFVQLLIIYLIPLQLLTLNFSCHSVTSATHYCLILQQLF